MNYKFIYWLVFLLGCSVFMNAQEVLTLEEATRLALENNYAVKIAKNDVVVAENQVDKGFVGRLPRVDLTAGARYDFGSVYAVTTKESLFPNYSQPFAPSGSINGGVNISYTLFDGKAAMTTYASLREMSKLSQQQSDLTSEGLVIQVINAYYSVAQLRENMTVFEELLQITQERIARAKVKFEYAATNKLEILNAEVDLNADSVNLVNAALNLGRAKRNLNRLMNRAVDTAFDIDPTVDFLPLLNLEELENKAVANNRQVGLSKQGIELSLLDLRSAEAANHPTVTLGGGYSVVANRNANIPQNIAVGVNGTLSTSLNLNYAIFDGGRRKIQQQNAKIAIENSELTYQTAIEDLKLDIQNAYADYENALYLLQIEQNNLVIAKKNFERSREAFNIGQINATDFRQAQFNLANLQTRIVNARYTAKIAEMELVRLSGDL